MSPAALRPVLALATLLAASTCDLPGPTAPMPTEGDPPLAVVAPSPPRGPIHVPAETARAVGPATSLVPLYAALEAIDTGAPTAPVVIMQIGDSHSASDFLSGRMRELFQQRFGGAGRGMLPPGIPYDYFRPALAHVDAEGDWHRASSFSGNGPFGIGGVIQQSADPNARMSLTETEPAGFDRAFFEVLRQPGAGTVRLRVDDGETHDFATASASVGPHWVEFNAPPGSHRISLSTKGGGAVTVLGWGTQRETRGVVYENLGIVGATVGVTGHWDPAAVAEEMARRDPALIVVAYGTNEGVEPPERLAHYAEQFAARVGALHAAAPGAAVLVIGPPDVDRKGQPIVAGCDGAWAPPPGIAIVREAQRAVAARQGWYFWDWQAAMGGPCAADRWARETPPLEAPDHVHQKADGYHRSAELLFREVIDGYRRYLSRPGAVGS
ncbi:MAG TPA: GDSL-type esterase/lipase family protein [Stellaceae bacterium]|jgi:lysophospholipase L1-like esterase|nr:GDSL-type esterase/lipase family protein [Stellaceae bacterium]